MIQLLQNFAIKIDTVFKVHGQEITKKNVLTSNNFARLANVVYAEEIPDKEYNELKTEHTYKIRSINGYTLYKSLKFKLFENCIIFCHLDFVHGLFQHLQNISEFKNIKLITSQSDNSVTKKLFRSKPKCISLWFSTNVEYSHSKLIPIPLGIANLRNTKNIIFEDFVNFDKEIAKKDTIFANFNLNTNYFHRYSALKKFIDNKSLLISKPTQKYSEYLSNLVESKFTLAPWGNGYDTHRIWESLYAGSFPITLNHQTFSNFSNLPIILLDSYNDFNKFDTSQRVFEDINYEALTITWWKNIISGNLEQDFYKVISFEEDDKKNYEIISEYQRKIIKVNILKKFKTNFRKLHKKTLGKKLNDLISI